MGGLTRELEESGWIDRATRAVSVDVWVVLPLSGVVTRASVLFELAGGGRCADVCSRMLTYAHVCSRMLKYAHVCSRMLTWRLAQVSCSSLLAAASVCVVC